MREIKFKAYCKIDHIVYEVLSIDFVREEICLWDKETTVDIDIDFDDVELMQCTGFKDINGVEIYEGNILQIDNRKAVVYCIENGFYLIDLTGSFIDDLIELGTQYPLKSSISLKSKVIGNIYENLELLE